MENKENEFFDRLKQEIENTTQTWPLEYLYKFIVPADTDKVAQVEAAFDGLGAVINKNDSKTGKYTSVSINVMMNSSDEIIAKYKQLSTVEGIISL